MKIIALALLAVLVSGCATGQKPEIIRGGKCQWIRENGDFTFTHYGLCDNPEHKQWKVVNQDNKY